MLRSIMMLGGTKTNLTSFFSLAYFAGFLPFCLIGYGLIPKRSKKYFLLIISYGFFWLISGNLIVYLIISTFSMFNFGLLLDGLQNKMKTQLKITQKENRKKVKNSFIFKQRVIVLFSVFLHIGVLLILKYSGFFATNINALFSHLNIAVKLEIPNYLMPIGISFFTLQALSYILDVYHEVTKADRNFFRLALFISFFPQIVEGPICRYNQTAEQLWNVKPIQYANLSLGLERILFGMMKKLVVADRLDPLVEKVFENYADYDGGIIAFASVCYTIQLYMDFSGSMDAVMGTAQVFGVCMPENFERPFFSKTISEFWKRWHITLGTWFKDYIFYPVITARSMKKMTSAARKKIGNHYGPLLAGSIALFCVWFCNGLWHGSAWNYIFFGMYHFTLILAGNIISPLRIPINKKLHINAKWFGYRLAQILRTTILVIIGELFFRAQNLRAGLHMFKSIVTDFSFSSFNEETLTNLKFDRYDLFIVGITVLIVFIVSVIKEKGIAVRKVLANKNVVLRWGVLYALIIFIVVFGAYGFGYAPVDPMYAQF